MNHRQPEQLNNAQFPAESEPEYTLEEIMAEFGAPQEPEPIPERMTRKLFLSCLCGSDQKTSFLF